jgi:dTMP kinase
VYSATKGLDVAWCKASDVGLPKPDVVIYLSVSPEVAKTRGSFGAERYENVVFQQGVRKHFEMFKALEYWHTINADGTVQQVKDAIEEVIMPMLDRHPTDEVGVWRGEPCE